MSQQPELPQRNTPMASHGSASDKDSQVFMVGTISKGEQRLLFVRTPPRPPFPGPWELRAVTRR